MGKIGALDVPRRLSLSCEEAWPRVRDEDEVFDVLQVMGWMPTRDGETWRDELDGLAAKGRALFLRVKSEELPNTNFSEGWTTRDHFTRIQSLFPQVEILTGGQEDSGINVEDETHSPESAALFLVQGWMPHIGPITVKELAERLGNGSLTGSSSVTAVGKPGPSAAWSFPSLLQKKNGVIAVS